MRPIVGRRAMRELDRIAIEELGIPSAVLMETAGRSVARATLRLCRRLEVRRGLMRPHTLLRSRRDGGRDSPCVSRMTVLAVCGVGNNGGDAVVAARQLNALGLHSEIVVLGPRGAASADTARQLDIAERLGLPLHFLDGASWQESFLPILARHDVVIDGIFGTGLARELDGIHREVVAMLAAGPQPVVSVDIPSGVDADTGQALGTAVSATVTVTFQHPKPGHLLFPGRALSGHLVVADIGIPRSLLARIEPAAHLIDDRAMRVAFPDRAGDAHKGQFGHLLVVAGAPHRPGAALLVGRAALRTGAGLVTIAADPTTVERLAPSLDELMGLPIDDHGRDDMLSERQRETGSGSGSGSGSALGLGLGGPGALHPWSTSIREALSSRSALAVGPSLDPRPLLARFLREVLESSPVPAVLDAGALTALGTDLEWLRERPGETVLTPHPGEMAALTGTDTSTIQRDRIHAALSLAERTGAHIVLKGASSVVASPDGAVFLTDAGNPGMATAGAGDVLTGVVGALLARGCTGSLAARAAVHLHARAGDWAWRRLGDGLVASDIIEALPRVLRRVFGKWPLPRYQGSSPRRIRRRRIDAVVIGDETGKTKPLDESEG